MVLFSANDFDLTLWHTIEQEVIQTSRKSISQIFSPVFKLCTYLGRIANITFPNTSNSRPSSIRMGS